MHLFTDDEIRKMSEQDIHQFMVKVHYEPNPDASNEELQQEIKRLQRNHTLAMWHDHSTILQTGYILCHLGNIRPSCILYPEILEYFTLTEG